MKRIPLAVRAGNRGSNAGIPYLPFHAFRRANHIQLPKGGWAV